MRNPNWTGQPKCENCTMALDEDGWCMDCDLSYVGGDDDFVLPSDPRHPTGKEDPQRTEARERQRTSCEGNAADLYAHDWMPPASLLVHFPVDRRCQRCGMVDRF